MAIPVFRSWPSSLIISFIALFMLVGCLLLWLLTIQQKDQEKERRSLERSRQGLIESGRTLLGQNVALIQERIKNALRQGEPQAFLEGWIDLSKMQLTVTKPMPQFEFQNLRQSESFDKWADQLNNDHLLDLGFPLRLIATVELSKSGGPLNADQERAWRENMTRLWHHLDGLDLYHYYALIMELPPMYQSAFSVQINLVRKALAVKGVKGQFMQVGDRLGFVRIPTEVWDDVRDSLAVMGLTLQHDQFGDVYPEMSLNQALATLEKRQHQDTILFGLSCLLIFVIFVLVYLALSATVRTHQQRQMLLHSVSHEFRTPLASVLQFSEMLLDRRFVSVEKSDQYLRLLHQEGLRLQSLLENVLMLARIEKRIFKVHKKRTEIVRFLKECEQQMVPPDAFYKHHLRFELNHPPCDVYLDSEALFRVLRNLVENAKKYGEPPVIVRSFLDQDLWHLEVHDCGPGLSKDVIRQLRTPFHRNTHHHGDGLGLGLHLATSIIHQHGGQIQFQKKEVGMCVAIQLFYTKQHTRSGACPDERRFLGHGSDD